MRGQLTYLMIAFLAMSIVSSCVEDDPLPISGDPPTSTILSTTSDTSLTSNSLREITATLNGFAVSSPLESLTIQKNGSVNFLDSLFIDGALVENPQIDLSGADKTNFSYDLSFNLIRGEDAVFTFLLVAENGDSRLQTFTLHVNPELTIPSETGDQLCDPGSLKTIEFAGLPGTTDLYSIGVFENSIPLDISRLSFGGISATANPIILDNDQLVGFNENIIFQIHPATDSTSSYQFVLTDDLGLESSISLLVKTTP